MNIVQAVDAQGFKLGTWRIIHLFEAGSALHGARLGESSDRDINGIFIEPKVNIFGLQPFEHFVSSTSDQSERNNANDVDVTLYSLRRWAFLACKGNPTALAYLFAPNAMQTEWNGQIVDAWGQWRNQLQKAIIAKSAAGHFMGFVSGQMKRLLGQGTGHHGQRKELIYEHGYDTKAAMHAFRLCYEGIELMQTGRITYPRAEKNFLISVRRGGLSLDTVNDRISLLLGELELARVKSSLRAKPDYDTVNQLLVDMYEDFYS